MVPDQVQQLGHAEQLITRCLRRWVVGAVTGDTRHWNLVWNDLASALGPGRGREALSALDKLVRRSCSGDAGKFRCHVPCCPFVGREELVMLALLSACQSGDGVAVRTAAEELVGSDPQGGIIEAAGGLARQIEAAGLILPRRETLACAPPLPAAACHRVTADGHTIH